MKWLANQKPQDDRAAIERLIRSLEKTSIEDLVLISTVDVYACPDGVYEDDPVDVDSLTPYGRHRRELELFAQDHFEATILRLPGLFGRGLKKNAIYDLLHENQLHRLTPDSRFQFYDLENLWNDVQKTRELDLSLLNVATEPVSVAEAARHAFGRVFSNPGAPAPASYDFRSRHDHLWGGSDGYLYDRVQVLTAMKAFVRDERRRARQ